MRLMVRSAWLALGAVLGVAGPAVAQDAVKIGVLNDMSSVYSETSGKGSVTAAEIAIADFGGKVLGKPIELISADNQNKLDIGALTARRWLDLERVTMIVDLPNTPMALAVGRIVADKGAILMTAAASSDITGVSCEPNTVHWGMDTYALGHTAANAMFDRGLASWFFITADYNFGYALERDTSSVVQARGGKVLGSVRPPLGTPDFSSFILQAQTSGAKVVALANAGGDAQASLKQASEYGLPQGGLVLIPLTVQINHLHGVGIEVSQGLYSVDSWYWDMSEGTRAFAKTFRARESRAPSSVQAATYSSVTHYLQAVQAAGTSEAKAVMQKMREMPIKDSIWPAGQVRTDGRAVYDVLLLQVKKPQDVKDEWAILNVVATVPGEKAFRPLKDGGCKLVKP